jgi:diphosphomevalonate decarboxylase
MLEPVFRAEVPSNIALIKYWGKRDESRQWPANDSLSMTLSVARTVTRAQKHDAPDHHVAFGGAKAERHVAYLARELGFSEKLRIDSHNTFPTACGIASSASGLGALTLAAIAAWTDSGDLLALERAGFSRGRLALLAAMGSGSAARSFEGGYVQWRAGGSPAEQQAQKLVEEKGAFELADLIVVLSEEKKAISSTEAHRSAWSSPLFEARLAGLPERLSAVREALLAHDLERLGPLIETEALEMHAVMLTSTPAAHYLKPDTSQFIAWLRAERRRGTSAYFTLDAGPNPHVLCLPGDTARLAERIAAEFPGARVIADRTGEGPSLCKESTP